MIKFFKIGISLLIIGVLSSSLYAKELTQERINEVLKEAYNKYKGDMGGANADYIKALAIVNPDIFGIAFVDTKGNVYEVGNTKELVSIQSISKVFTAALVMSERGSSLFKKK